MMGIIVSTADLYFFKLLDAAGDSENVSDKDEDDYVSEEEPTLQQADEISEPEVVSVPESEEPCTQEVEDDFSSQARENPPLDVEEEFTPQDEEAPAQDVDEVSAPDVEEACASEGEEVYAPEDEEVCAPEDEEVCGPEAEEVCARKDEEVCAPGSEEVYTPEVKEVSAVHGEETADQVGNICSELYSAPAGQASLSENVCIIFIPQFTTKMSIFMFVLM